MKLRSLQASRAWMAFLAVLVFLTTAARVAHSQSFTFQSSVNGGVPGNAIYGPNVADFPPAIYCSQINSLVDTTIYQAGSQGSDITVGTFRVFYCPREHTDSPVSGTLNIRITDVASSQSAIINLPVAAAWNNGNAGSLSAASVTLGTSTYLLSTPVATVTEQIFFPDSQNVLLFSLSWGVYQIHICGSTRFDLNGDQQPDLLWRNTTTGDLTYWLMNGPNSTQTGTLQTAVPLSLQLCGIADLNADGNADLIWRNTKTGDVTYWLMNGLTVLSTGTLLHHIPLEWKLVSVIDLNGDGSPDLLWQNTRNGNVMCSLLDGVQLIKNVPILSRVALTWEIVGVADFNGDGKPDILWQNTRNGNVMCSLLDGLKLTKNVLIATEVPLALKVRGVPDLNGDGKPDLLWQNTRTGDVTYWLMNGLTKTQTGTIATGVPLEWEICGLR